MAFDAIEGVDTDDEVSRIVVDGKSGRPFRRIQDLFVTSEGTAVYVGEEKDKTYIRRERRYGAFTRSLPLPDGVDPKKIKAKTQDGVLEVTVPLPKEVAKQEPIKITPTTG